ncbi:MAG: adenylate/guanylate cyclase domain-containing protein [Deltaproteobacteria bacterium]
MRAWCPHCGALNEFQRPPTTAIVYCQHCRKPFGAAAIQAGGGSTTPPPQVPRQQTPQRHASNPGTPPGGVPRTPDGEREATAPFRAGRRRRRSGPVAAAVIVPKARDKTNDDDTPLAKILYVSPDGLETDFVLDEVNSVGRHPKNNIRLNDREISKEHAIIELRGSEWWVRDLNSSNGTYLNTRRITEAHMKDGDELLLGSMRLQFVMQVPDDPRTSVRDLVTILPQDPAGSTHIHAKLQEEEEEDFKPVTEVHDVEVLKRDYEKLRLSHELARIGLTTDLSKLLQSTLDVVFSMFPADNAVIMLVDADTNTLVPHTVRQKDGSDDKQEILLSSTIVNGALQERASVLSSDAFLDPRFSGSQSIIAQGIRAAMCVPLVAHDKVLGLMHLDSRERVGAFTEKDLQVLKAIATQTAIAIENARLVRQIEEEAKTRGQLNRFLPPHVVEEMVQGKGQPIQKGGRETEASVVFCDIRGFTSLSETAGGPQEVVDLLNEYFERLVEIVFTRHGVLDKFIGDALMATWGTLEGDDVEESTYNCVAAAIEFRDAIRDLNDERALRNADPIRMGVGVNTGQLVAGYMGSKRRLEYTVIGDTVNTASRLCGLAEGDQVIISDRTQALIADRIEARYLGTRQVKGKEQEVNVYEAVRLQEGADSATGS